MSAEMLAGIAGAAAGLVMACVAMAGFWMALGGRVQKAETNSESAMQFGAENGEDIKRIYSKITELQRGCADDAERARREFGQTVEAIRTKVHEFETWSRDEFMRKQSFEAIIARNERLQEVRDKKIDDRFDRMENKLDEAVSALIAVSRGKGPNNTSQS